VGQKSPHEITDLKNLNAVMLLQQQELLLKLLLNQDYLVSGFLRITLFTP
jgi:hypothetical protein